jgi:hypothetical protein
MMMYKENVTVLVPSELLYAFDPDNENTFVAAREKGLIVFRPINAHADNQCDVNSKYYQKGYLLGLSEGYHKGYADAMAYEDMQTEGLEDDDFPDCPGFCNACPHYDDLFDSCKFYP